MCFHAALQLGARARELGLEDRVRFLHWRVRNDAHFREHWALSFRGAHVLDVTAVQVDGNSNPLRKRDSYPTHFGTPRDYPLDLILRHAANTPQASASQRVPVALIWRVQRSMIAYDFHRASSHWSARPLLVAAGRLMETLLVLFIHGLSDWARSRLTTLKSRLSVPVVPPNVRPASELSSPDLPSWRIRAWRAAADALRRVARAACALFFLGIPV